MKNTKTILGSSAAIVAAAALIGGGTFANWSDFDLVEDNVAQAGALTVAAGADSVIDFSATPLAPGENKVVYRYVASRSDQTTVLENAQLSLQIENLVGSEDGCTSNSEGVEDADCADTASEGEFVHDAWLQVRKGIVRGEDACDESTSTSAITDKRLEDWEDVSVDLAALDPDEGICVAFELGMPDGVTSGSNFNTRGIDFANATSSNASQGDGASFDVRFTLTQQVDSQ